MPAKTKAPAKKKATRRRSTRKVQPTARKKSTRRLDKVAKDTERDYFMSAEEATEYNLVDRVIDQR